MSTADPNPVYFELSWSILSSIGLLSALAGILVAGITSFSPLSAVPIVVSSACALSNGLCYYAFYTDFPVSGRVVGAAVADIAWLIQEAGLSFYSYLILIRFLRGKSRRIFLSIFWIFIAAISAIRMVILVSRTQNILAGNDALQDRINHLHEAYFACIALVEMCSGYFLLRIFASGQKSSQVLAQKTSLFRQLTRSTEIRLTSLAFIGLGRTVTYWFQADAQSAESVVNQFDRFLATLECFFPIIMMIDLLAAKLMRGGYQADEASSRIRKNGIITAAQGIELGRTNEGARQSMKRQEFVRIEAHDDQKSSAPSTPTKLADRTMPITVERTLTVSEERMLDPLKV